MRKIGFALIAETNFVNKIVNLEHDFHEKAGFFDSLGIIKNLPHLTLFQGEMNDKMNYQEVADKIARVFDEMDSSPMLHFTHIDYIPQGWYFLLCEKSKELEALHFEVLRMIEQYISLPEDRLTRCTNDMPRAQIEAIQRYNYRFAGDAFFPHITIGRSSERNEDVLNEMNMVIKQINLSPSVDKITVYKMGRNGTHEETLYEIKLVSKQ